MIETTRASVPGPAPLVAKLATAPEPCEGVTHGIWHKSSCLGKMLKN